MRRFYFQIIEYDGTNDLWLKQSSETLGLVTDTEISNVITRLPETISQELDIKNNTSTVSSINISVLNKDLAISSIIYNDFYHTGNLYDKKCVIGYYDSLTPGSKTPIYTGYLKEIDFDLYETVYFFELQDGIDKLKNSSLTSTSTDAEIFALSTLLSEVLPDVAGLPAGSSFSRFGRKENSGNTGSVTGIYNFEETLVQATFDGWDEKWIILSWTGHPIDFVKYLFEQLNVEYDNTSFEEVRDDSKNSAITSFYFEFKEPLTDTLDFITNQIFRPLNCFPIIKSDGLLYLGLHKQPDVTNLPIIFDENNTRKTILNKSSRENIINHTFVAFDYNIETDKFINRLYDVDNPDLINNTDSVLAFGYQPKTPEIIEYKGINQLAVIGGDSTYSNRILFAQNSASYLFDRFALTTRTISLEAMYSHAKDISLGDVVAISGTKLVQWKGTGKATRGLPLISTDEYGKIDITTWGEYTDVYEGNLFLDETTTPRSIDVQELITLQFFQDLLDNYNLDSDFLAQHNRN